MDIPPPYRRQLSADEDHLNLLAIFHFIGAGLALVALLFLAAHFAFFTAITSASDNPQVWVQPGGRPFLAPQNPQSGFSVMPFFWFFRLFYLVGGIWLLLSAVLNVLSGLWLRARAHRTRSIVVAAIDFLHVPFGTILGIFTIVVLSRDSVRRIYGE